MDIFESLQDDTNKPLAERLRPKSFSEFVGQSQIVGEKAYLFKSIKTQNYLPNLILWGPPGTGKTSFARLFSNEFDCHYITLNAINTGAKEIREIGEKAKRRRIELSRKTLLFIDEIHRLNKAQQDVLLPYTEQGDFVLIGATTENPSYELNSALLSRSKVLVFEPHSLEELKELTIKAERLTACKTSDLLTEESLDFLCLMAKGDARQLINHLEQVVTSFQMSESGLEFPLSGESLEQLLVKTPTYYDKKGDEHYNCTSAFIKSIRGSDPDAAVYYLARMIHGGEDPVFIARRLVILASEDIGNADPRAITVTTSVLKAVESVGLPEAGINLAQAVIYLSSAPKSNRSYMAYKKALALVEKTGALPVPKSLRSSRTKMAKKMGFGKDYKYSHKGLKGWLEQDFLPEEISGHKFYEASERGFEKNITQYLEWMKNQ